MDYAQLNIDDFRPGIYLHFKNHLYEADHLTHNASGDNRVEVHYIGLQLSAANEGPRHATREFNNFFNDYIHKDDGKKCEHGTSTEHLCKSNQQIAPRFRYLGPVFEAWMLDADTWNLPKNS